MRPRLVPHCFAEVFFRHVDRISVFTKQRCQEGIEDYIFQPIALETLGPLNAPAFDFLSEVGRRLSSLSGDPHGDTRPRFYSSASR